MDYFNYARRRNGPVSQDRLDAPLPPTGETPGPQTPGPQTPGGRQPGGPPSLESLRQPSSIRIRRLPSGFNTPRPGSQQADQTSSQRDLGLTGRRRSQSDPHRYGANLAPPALDISRQRTHEMPTLTEETPGARHAPSESTQDWYEAQETPRPQTPAIEMDDGSPAERVITGASNMQDAGNAARANRGLQRFRTGGSAMPRDAPAADEYNSDVVDLLDLVGMPWQPTKHFLHHHRLICSRSGGTHTGHSDKCSKLSLRSRSRRPYQSKANLQSHSTTFIRRGFFREDSSDTHSRRYRRSTTSRSSNNRIETSNPGRRQRW